MADVKSFKTRGVLPGLILLYWFTRLTELDALPFFIDEGYHLRIARLVWALQPFHGASDGRLLSIWWMACFWPFHAGVWVSRAGGLLVTTAGLACVLSVSRRFFSDRAAMIAGLLYTFLPLTFFFERMALADTFSAPFVAGTLWAVSLWLRPSARFSPRSYYALCTILGGVALTAGILSKISNLIFLCIPVLAAIIFHFPVEWRKGVLLASATYLVCLITLYPVMLVLRFLVHSDMGLDLVASKAEIPLAELASQIQSTGSSILHYFVVYMPFPLWAVILLGMSIGLWRFRRFSLFIAGALALTLWLVIARTSPSYIEARFLPAYAPLIVIGASSGLGWLTQKWKRVWLIAAMMICLGSGALFMWVGWRHPEKLNLPERDRWQYVTGWPSGYGFREIAASFMARDEPITLSTLDLGGKERFDAYLLGKTSQVVAKPYEAGMSLDNVLLVIDLPKDNQQLAGLPFSLVEISRYPRPGGESALVLYRVEP